MVLCECHRDCFFLKLITNIPVFLTYWATLNKMALLRIRIHKTNKQRNFIDALRYKEILDLGRIQLILLLFTSYWQTRRSIDISAKYGNTFTLSIRSWLSDRRLFGLSSSPNHYFEYYTPPMYSDFGYWDNSPMYSEIIAVK